MTDAWVTIPQAARLLGMSETKIDRLITAGVASPTRVGPTRCLAPADVERLREHAADGRKRAG